MAQTMQFLLNERSEAERQEALGVGRHQRGEAVAAKPKSKLNMDIQLKYCQVLRGLDFSALDLLGSWFCEFQL